MLNKLTYKNSTSVPAYVVKTKLLIFKIHSQARDLANDVQIRFTMGIRDWCRLRLGLELTVKILSHCDTNLSTFLQTQCRYAAIWMVFHPCEMQFYHFHLILTWTSPHHKSPNWSWYCDCMTRLDFHVSEARVQSSPWNVGLISIY